MKREAGLATQLELPWLRELVNGLEYGTIYHGHVFYFSLAAALGAARLAGLELFDVSRQNVHGNLCES